ncbi:MAG: EF-Tu/IF-2/RF-3 family GTPase, partial [Anaerolineales bacterium]
FAMFKSGETLFLLLFVIGDAQGSLEPFVISLMKFPSTDGPTINVLYSETGNITENDVMLATASNAILIGFNVSADTGAQRLAETNGISIRQYDVIYRLIEDVEKALKGLLGPEFKPVVIGHAEVRAVFKIPKFGHIAGCIIRDGEARRNARVRVLRQNKVEYEGEVGSLKREKEDVREVQKGIECGVGVKDYDGVHQGDILEFFVIQQVN